MEYLKLMTYIKPNNIKVEIPFFIINYSLKFIEYMIKDRKL